jgi:hypothetical protein
MVQAQLKLTATNEMPTLHSSQNATSTSGLPTPEREAEVYSIQRRQLERVGIDWAAEAATWGVETREWVEEVSEVAGEALPE